MAKIYQHEKKNKSKTTMEWTAKIIKHEVYKKDCYRLGSVVFERKPKFIIDIGANWGWFTILAAEKHKNSKILSFEPISENFEKLKENLEKEKNRVKNNQNIQLYKKIVTGNNKAITMRDPKFHSLDGPGSNPGAYKTIYENDSSYLSIKRTKPWSDEEVKDSYEQISIAEIIEEHDIDYIDFLKLDCEGCEYELFEQIFEKNLHHKILNLSMEVHGKKHPEWIELEKKIKSEFHWSKFQSNKSGRNNMCFAKNWINTDCDHYREVMEAVRKKGINNNIKEKK